MKEYSDYNVIKLAEVCFFALRDAWLWRSAPHIKASVCSAAVRSTHFWSAIISAGVIITHVVLSSSPASFKMPLYLTFIFAWTPFLSLSFSLNMGKHTCWKTLLDPPPTSPSQRRASVEKSPIFSSNQMTAHCQHSCLCIPFSLYSAQLIISRHSYPPHIIVRIQHTNCDSADGKKRNLRFLSPNAHPPTPLPPSLKSGSGQEEERWDKVSAYLVASLQIHFWGEHVEIPIHFQRDPPELLRRQLMSIPHQLFWMPRSTSRCNRLSQVWMIWCQCKDRNTPRSTLLIL